MRWAGYIERMGVNKCISDIGWKTSRKAKKQVGNIKMGLNHLVAFNPLRPSHNYMYHLI
jgi:hypothetical protein